MVGKKRHPLKMIVPKRREILEVLETIGSSRDRALIATLYLTGARVSEVLKTHLLKRQIYERDDVVVFEHLPVLKKRKPSYRDVEVIKEIEVDFLKHIEEHWETIPSDDMPLFTISRERCWQIIKRLGWFPHFLRHSRATHLAKAGFDTGRIMAFFKWSPQSTAVAMNYTHLSQEDIYSKLQEVKEKLKKV